jgi:hypothetical protein
MNRITAKAGVPDPEQPIRELRLFVKAVMPPFRRDQSQLAADRVG